MASGATLTVWAGTARAQHSKGGGVSRMYRVSGPRLLHSKFGGKCAKCGQAIKEGQVIVWEPGKPAFHHNCQAPDKGRALDPNNPFLRRAMGIERALGGNFKETIDYQQMIFTAPEKCGLCGQHAHYVATIGTHKCDHCGALRVGHKWETSHTWDLNSY